MNFSPKKAEKYAQMDENSTIVHYDDFCDVICKDKELDMDNIKNIKNITIEMKNIKRY